MKAEHIYAGIRAITKTLDQSPEQDRQKGAAANTVLLCECKKLHLSLQKNYVNSIIWF